MPQVSWAKNQAVNSIKGSFSIKTGMNCVKLTASCFVIVLSNYFTDLEVKTCTDSDLTSKVTGAQFHLHLIA